MKSKQISTTQSTSLNVDELIRKAENIGFSEVPESTDQIVTAMLQGLKNSKKIVTAKMLQTSMKVKSNKWFSDTLWKLAKKGVLIKHKARGYYSYNFANEPKVE